MTPSSEHIAEAVALLEATGDFRILQRFEPHDHYAQTPDVIDQVMDNYGPPLKTALYVDVETTGLDTERDRVIELAMVPFEFDQLGNIYTVGAGESWFSDPGMPIPPEITKLTSITDEMVLRKSIDANRVQQQLAGASVVIAHHADYDRRMLERVDSAFRTISWGCPHVEVPWRDRLGCTSAKLVHILAETCGEFYDAHRALDDCFVGIHVLATAQLDGRPVFAHLLDSVRKPSMRIWAIGAPFPTKDRLKAHGYAWSDGTKGTVKAWYRDIALADEASEREWLRKNADCWAPTAIQVTARDRYSRRVV